MPKRLLYLNNLCYSLPMAGLSDFTKPDFQKQALQMQQNLAAQSVTIEENGVKIVITGDQRLLVLEVQGYSNQVLTDAINKAIKKSQEMAAKELMKISGGMM